MPVKRKAIGRFEDAADIICQSIQLPQFRSTPDSQRAMNDLQLACEVKASLVETHPEVCVVSRSGNVLVCCVSSERQGRRVRQRAEALAAERADIHNIEVHVGAEAPPDAV